MRNLTSFSFQPNYNFDKFNHPNLIDSFVSNCLSLQDLRFADISDVILQVLGKATWPLLRHLHLRCSPVGDFLDGSEGKIFREFLERHAQLESLLTRSLYFNPSDLPVSLGGHLRHLSYNLSLISPPKWRPRFGILTVPSPKTVFI